MERHRFAARITKLFESTSRERSVSQERSQSRQRPRISKPGYFKPSSL
jgi:hypothetical protein